jgi:hypothetical protein
MYYYYFFLCWPAGAVVPKKSRSWARESWPGYGITGNRKGIPTSGALPITGTTNKTLT